MTEPWPFPEHTAQDRDRVVCEIYRAALQREAPQVAAQVDGYVRRYGFPWLFAPREGSGERMTRAEVAEYAGVERDTVSAWVHRGYLTRLAGGGYLRAQVEKFVGTQRGPGRRRTAVNAHQLDL